MSSASNLAPGARVGPYEVLTLLGEGGMGQVYRARDERLSREVALKVVHADLAQDAERLRRFEHEAKAAGTLNHPNIVAVYDTGRSNGSPYIVSELLQGETLRDRMATGAVGVRKAVDYGVQIARGLAAAHEKGIVHRDLKPENLFLTKDGLVKILDFGIAKLGRPGEEQAGTDIETLSRTGTSPGTMLGTVGYMSPEQVRGLPTDHRSDLFSFGTVLYEMLTGKRAFKRTTAADTLSAILREDPTEADGTGAGLPAGLLRVVRRCLEKSPDDRFQGARDLAFALESAVTDATKGPALPERFAAKQRRLWLAAIGAVALAAAGAGLWAGRTLTPPRTPTSYQRLTFRIGQLQSAQFAPDQQTIVYSARWGTGPSELFTTRPSTPGSRSLGVRDASILAISAREEMALLLRPRALSWASSEGTLARMPLAGGTAREVLEGVTGADWSPDGRELAVTHGVNDRYRLEYPIGKVLYEPEPPRWLEGPRISPSGDQIALVEHPLGGDQRGEIAVFDRGQRRVLASGFAALDSPFWSPRGDEIWFVASRSGSPQQIHGVTLSGRTRVVEEFPGYSQLCDLTRDGRALLERATVWNEVRARARASHEEAELPAADVSSLSDIADDGSVILGTDVGWGGGPNFSLYVEKTDGSPPVWLGEGDGQALAPDGRFALAVLLQTKPQQLLLVPTAAGETRTLEPGEVVRYERAVFDPSGRRVVFAGADGQDVVRIYVQDVAGGPPRAVTEADVTLAKLGRPVSPDGTRVVAFGADGVPALYPLAGGDPTAISGVDALDVPIAWTPDGRELVVVRYEETPPSGRWIDVGSGRTRPWPGLGRSVPSGQFGDYRLLVTPDGRSYAYSFARRLSDLYLTSPLK
jgi:Tol biopolymer transport system component/tRNA A-37 threonylcarbamoyl transferase component Bud32